MLIRYEDISAVLVANNIHINGAFHIGAHDCEELDFYHKMNLKNENVIWIEAIPSKVQEALNRNIPNVYNHAVTDQDDAETTFHISNNVQSSSVLEFGTHAQEHPSVVYVDRIQLKSITIDTFFERNHIDRTKHDFWNFDIQGAELMALKGAVQSIKHAKAIYLEVNEKELYKGCGLITDVDAFLANYKFERVLTQMTRHGWGDALYILKV